MDPEPNILLPDNTLFWLSNKVIPPRLNVLASTSPVALRSPLTKIFEALIILPLTNELVIRVTLIFVISALLALKKDEETPEAEKFVAIISPPALIPPLAVILPPNPPPTVKDPVITA